jgi:hypothetical protein
MKIGTGRVEEKTMVHVKSRISVEGLALETEKAGVERGTKTFQENTNKLNNNPKINLNPKSKRW